MTPDTHEAAAVGRRLWDDIQRHQVGMLGLTGAAPPHFQPMTGFAEPEAGEIWFFAPDDGDLARLAADGRPAMFIFQGKDLRACVAGELSVRRDRARMDRYWNAVIAAWRPQGRDDPHLTLLRLDCTEAEVWLSDGGPIRFAWEIAKANARRRVPDLGSHAHLNFH